MNLIPRETRHRLEQLKQKEKNKPANHISPHKRKRTKPLTILISGGEGLLAKHLIKANGSHKIIAPTHTQMDVINYDEVRHAVNFHKPDIFLHCAAMTTPMEHHNQWPATSINTNIMGTAIPVMVCQYNGGRTRFVYISTDYVYPGVKALCREDSPLQPINNYAKSKLAGEMAAQMLPDSLILRCAFTKRPFQHPRAFTDCIKSYLYVDEIAPIILRLIESGYAGVVNVGGKRQSIYRFAKKSNPDVGTITRAEVGDWIPADTSMNLVLMRRLLANDPTL